MLRFGESGAAEDAYHLVDFEDDVLGNAGLNGLTFFKLGEFDTLFVGL